MSEFDAQTPKNTGLTEDEIRELGLLREKIKQGLYDEMTVSGVIPSSQGITDLLEYIDRKEREEKGFK